MDNDFQKFQKKNYKSPLGVIGLFITLVYGIAAWLFDGIVAQLHIGLQIVLVSFVVLYPCILLGVFYAFITRHSKKVYAPQDFRSDEDFLKYHNETTQEKIDDYDPALRNKLKSSSSPKTINSILGVLGKESLAIELVKRHYENKYGARSVRICNSGQPYDLVVATGHYKRLMVEVKLLSTKSSLMRIIPQAYKTSEMIMDWGSLGGSKDRDFLLFALIDAPEREVESLRKEFGQICLEKNISIDAEFVSYSQFASQYIQDISLSN